ncbi:hypothetical protein ACEZ3G_10400 [Maribacter algicola]|uniref:Uncharacterized protein n=1 Tax=Meishania litoralis TaxID=3434685 RepID=A0ACC7LPG3_9FLAO
MKYSILIFFALLIIISCAKSSNTDFDREPVANLIIENDKVICEFCDGFGSIIETYENQIFVGGEKKIWVFERNGQTTSLFQEIDLANVGSLNSIKAADGSLFLGLIDDEGTGRVRQYTLNNTEWQFTKDFQVGRNQDNFGNDIAIKDTLMIIGASAIWDESFSIPNKDEGSFYIFGNKGGDWIQTQEFYSENRSPDDHFGKDVIIADNFVVVTGLSIPMHVYEFENTEWNLASVENNIVPADIDNNGNTFLYYSEMLGLQSFSMNPNGSISPITINANLDLGLGLQFYGDSMSMTQDHALIATLGGHEVYLLQLVGNEWVLKKTLAPGNEPQSKYSGLKLTPEQALIGGISSDGVSYLFFENF